ncbi:Phenylalanine N-monooxygenase -like protein [Gossypium arboreum]|uniref:Phenylalanine N-monooxygenase-like protein n=1 Tax=Gossypium arboreum TaxID=29729 RepID=A0A0B0MEM6_GOSAR|nr:Phenylalanine N-monooxygenase -like protein [Gossypium arboreum]
MPQSPQDWPFPNRIKLGLDRGSPMCKEVHAMLEPVNTTRACGIPV